jgi:hypothetical protein
MKLEFFDNNQFVLNSGIRDNRTVIQNMPVGEEWVLDCKIVNSTNDDVTDEFVFSLGEYVYNTYSGGYDARHGSITFSEPVSASGEELGGKPSDVTRQIFTVTDSSYNNATFTKNSKIYLKIKPS